MATPEAIGIRREGVMAELTTQLGAMGEALGIEIPPAPTQNRHEELREVELLEWARDVAQIVGPKAARLSDAKVLASELDSVTNDRKALADEVKALNAIVSERDATSEAMQRLVGLTATDDLVRFALTKVGFVQAKPDEGGEDWSVSVVGLGPDLFAEPFEPSAADAPSEPETTNEPKRTRAKNGSA